MLYQIFSGLLGVVIVALGITVLLKNARTKRLADMQTGIPKPTGKLYWSSRIVNWVAALAPFALLGLFFFGMFGPSETLSMSILGNFQLYLCVVVLIEIIAFIVDGKYKNRRNEELGKPKGSGSLSSPVFVGIIAIALFIFIILSAVGGLR